MVSGVARLELTIIPQRFSVVHHRAERLTEFMRNRTGQRRHGLAATGVGGERQVSQAVDLGPPPCAALEQQPDDQHRLDTRAPATIRTVPRYSPHSVGPRNCTSLPGGRRLSAMSQRSISRQSNAG